MSRENSQFLLRAAIDSAGTDKAALRHALRKARRSLSAAEQSSAAICLVDRLLGLTEVEAGNHIALYLPNDGEIDPSALIAWCEQTDRSALLPVVRQKDGKNSLLFAPVTSISKFEDNRFGIPEPVVDEQSLVEAHRLDLVLLPLVGFDQAGNRIGMGGGFYDTTFEFVRSNRDAAPTMIGLAHDVQRVDRIDAESWDIPLHTIVTDRKVYQFNLS